VNDAEPLYRDPAMRWLVGGRALGQRIPPRAPDGAVVVADDGASAQAASDTKPSSPYG
jgi:hypothetical protein